MMNTNQGQASIRCAMRHAALGLAVALAPTFFVMLSAQAQTHTVLYSFSGGTDGATPRSGLIFDTAGNLYGTTSAGGVSNLGTVFELDPAGHETRLHSFTGGADGATPYAGLVLDAAGNLYGTTQVGGVSNLGTVFKLDTNNTETVLYSFAGGADGALPYAGVVLDAAGNLYGATSAGGLSNNGTVFKLDTTGTETVLYAFTGGADGGGPLGDLILDAAGNLLGTANYGGDLLNGCFDGFGCGVVFKVDSTGIETVLYAFQGGADGGNPFSAGLLLDAAGNLWGTTSAGGGASDGGTVFKLDPVGTETVFHILSGEEPLGAVVLDVNGNLYTTTSTGASGFGTVFQIDLLDDTETALHTFTGGADGASPQAGLVQDAAGNLYGSASGLGTANFGTVFKIAPDFSLTASAFTPSFVSPGASSTSTVNIFPLGGFSSAATLSCAVHPAPALAPKCSISPASISLGVAATLTVTTTGTTASALPTRSGSALFYALSLPLIGAVAGVGFGSDRKKIGKGNVCALACVLLAGLVFVIACGGGSTSTGGGGGTGGTPAGTYTIVVTGVSASGQHSTTTTLTVQ